MALEPQKIDVSADKKINLEDRKVFAVPQSEERFELVEGQRVIAFQLPEAVPAGKVAEVRVEVRVRWRDVK